MPDETQNSQSLIYVQRDLAGQPVRQRAKDGYFDATAMCVAASKLFGHWKTNDGTQALLEAFSADIGIPISELIQSLKGGPNRGTWIHPKVAVSLAMWLSPQFHVKVCHWVYEEMVGATRQGGPMSREEINTMMQKAVSEVVFNIMQSHVMPTISGELDAMAKRLRREFASASGGIHRNNPALATAQATAAVLAPQFNRVHETTSRIAQTVEAAYSHQQQVERLTFTEFLRRLNCKPNQFNKNYGCRFHAMARAFLKRNPSFQIECDGTGAKALYSTRMVTAIFEHNDRGQILFYQITGRNVIDHKPARANGSGVAQTDMFVQH
jgi:KilA-N domain